MVVWLWFLKVLLIFGKLCLVSFLVSVIVICCGCVSECICCLDSRFCKCILKYLFMIFWMFGIVIVWVCVVSKLCSVFLVKLVVIGWWKKFVLVVSVLSVFFRLCMLEWMCLVSSIVMFLFIFMFLLCVLDRRIVVCVLKFGGLIVIDKF